MSIAADEAFEWHGLNGDENGDKDSTYSAEELDNAYIAGRSAGITDAEVDAAALTIWDALNPSEPNWTEIPWPEDEIEKWHEVGRKALDAARKTVAE